MLIKDTYCWKCRKNTHFIAKDVNQVLWLFITIMTGGIGAVIWLFKNLNKGLKCNTCGQREIK
jgi:hypothetical protein